MASTNFERRSVLDGWTGFEYASVHDANKKFVSKKNCANGTYLTSLGVTWLLCKTSLGEKGYR